DGEVDGRDAGGPVSGWFGAAGAAQESVDGWGLRLGPVRPGLVKTRAKTGASAVTKCKVRWKRSLSRERIISRIWSIEVSAGARAEMSKNSGGVSNEPVAQRGAPDLGTPL